MIIYYDIKTPRKHWGIVEAAIISAFPTLSITTSIRLNPNS